VKRAAVLALALLAAAPRLVTAQADRGRGVAALGELIRGLGVTTRVLMIGAHPDDEDTQLITWLARARGVETAYLSLTRGDGGQNLIGNELGEALGVIRTEELLAARRIDGGRQYFTRAYDFGFSKSAEETYRHWPKYSILRDVVAVVRKFRPHVIVSVFSGTARDGHGHHQVAGLLAREAYELAGDTVRVPVDPRERWDGGAWTPLKFYRSSRFSPDSATLEFNVGEYDALHGRSYAEIAAESRSQHKSQGFGSLGRRGVVWAYLRREATRVNAGQEARMERSIFDGIDTSLARVRAQAPRRHHVILDSLAWAIRDVAARWRSGGAHEDPARLVTPLKLVQRFAALANDSIRETGYDYGSPCPAVAADACTSLSTILGRAETAAELGAGIIAEATAPHELYPVGVTVPISVALYNRGRRQATVFMAYAWPRPDSGTGPTAVGSIPPDSVLRFTLAGQLNRPTQPWWLMRPRRGDVFDGRVERLDGGPYVGAGYDESGNWAPEAVALYVAVGSDTIGIVKPVVRRFADPVRGEVERPVAGVPTVTLTLDGRVEYARANTPMLRTLRVTLRSAVDAARSVEVALELPAGLTADPRQQVVTLPARGEAAVTFTLRGTLQPGRHKLAARAVSAGRAYETGYVTIDYEHIRPQRLYQQAALEIEAVDVVVPQGLSVAYVAGVSDNVAPAIEKLGVPVTPVGAAALAGLDPARTPVLVIGPRAYEANDSLRANAEAVLDFARRGGTVVVQYGQHEMARPGIMPHPIALERRADRVSEEDAPVRVLDRSSPILDHPNRITDRDFAGWVQERALYMPRTFDARYHAPLSMNDPGEPPNQGAILVAPVGRGTYVYTTLAFFRQLPAGHPGAARLFVNLLAAGQRPARR
jgi:LmbE family N-acetylglucosaminyl deacetylase